MKDDPGTDSLRDAERAGGRYLRRAVIFGVLAATAQMAVLLWFMFG